MAVSLGVSGSDAAFARAAARLARCGAFARTSGRPCRRRPEPGSTRCRHHGGASTGRKTRAGDLRAALGGLRLGPATRARLAAELAELDAARALLEGEGCVDAGAGEGGAGGPHTPIRQEPSALPAGHVAIVPDRKVER